MVGYGGTLLKELLIDLLFRKPAFSLFQFLSDLIHIQIFQMVSLILISDTVQKRGKLFLFG